MPTRSPSSHHAIPPADLAGRTAVVTGAGNGIGQALALEAARNGMTVVLIDIDEEGLTKSLRQITEAGAVGQIVRIDVRDRSALIELASNVPPPGLLFANAGILRNQSILNQSPDDIRLMLDVNIAGVLNTLQAFAPTMIHASAPSQIVITGSQAAFVPFPDLGVYSATKHALWAIADTLSTELKASNAVVGASLLAPGSVATDIYGETPPPNASLSQTPEAVARRAFAGALNRDRIISSHNDLIDRIQSRMNGLKSVLTAET